MGDTIFFTIISVVLISVIALIGIFALGLKDKLLQKILHLMVAFSAGALVGDVFLHLLPESFEKFSSESNALGIFVGIIIFFVLEKVLRWRHCHEGNCEEHPRHLGVMNLIGDGVHNFIDGVLIGASYMASIPIGVATTVAVILHEIPQEIGDFGVLIHSGFSKAKAIQFNFISACAAILGAILILLIGQSLVRISDFMIPLAAGGFLYIALSDLIPELHKDSDWQKSVPQLISMIFGIAVMYLLLFVE